MSTVELKVWVPLTHLSAVSSALSAALATAYPPDPILPQPDAEKPAPTPEVAKATGKGKKAADTSSAAPAEAASSAEKQTPASTPASATTESAAPTLTYEKSGYPERIVKLVEASKVNGVKTKVDKLKAHLASLGLKTAKDLKPEQLADFGEMLNAIEADEPEDDIG